jgi:hypothetical protein
MKDLYPQDYWSTKRRELCLWFSRNAASLGELYKGALFIYFTDAFPGRIRFVAHAVREIRNRLPDVIAGPKPVSPLQYKNRLDKVVDIWERSGLPTDGSIPTKITKDDSLPLSLDVPVPIKVYMEIATLIRDHINAREKPREAAMRLFQAIDPKNKQSEATLRPRIDNWLDVTKWFAERVHDSGATDIQMEADELQKRFEIFEAALSAMIKEFFKTEKELDEILGEANS